jgi:hypothetical protein
MLIEKAPSRDKNFKIYLGMCHVLITEFSELSIPEHFEPGPARARPAPGPPTNLTGRAWAEILKPAKNFFGPSLARNAVFSCFTL